MKDNKQNPVKVPIKPILVKKANSTTSQAQSTPQPSSQSTSSTNKPVTTATNVTNKALPIAANQPAPVSPTNKPANLPNQATAKTKVANQPNTTNTAKVATATTTVKTTPSKPTTAKAISIAPVTINRPSADDSLTKANLDICVKITELPTELNTNAEGTKEFFVTANNRQVFIALKTKQYNKLLEAQAKWSSWIGRISGKLGASTIDGFILEQGSVQAFERVVKAENIKPNPNVNASTSANDGTTVNTNSSNINKDNLPVTNQQYKEICKLLIHI